MEQVIEKKGLKPGKTSVIMAGVHGNEVCGVEAFKLILPNLEIQKGKVIFIFGNPKAIKKNQRYTEVNLNRLFSKGKNYNKKIKSSYEYKRSIFIKKFLNKADALLDIHSTTHKNAPFIICEKNANKIINSFPKDFKRVLYNFNNIEPGGTEGYMNDMGKVGICIECGQHEEKKSIQNAVKAIQSFLVSQGHIEGDKDIKFVREKIKMSGIYYTKTNQFVLKKKFKDFEPINKGQVIGTDGNEVVKAAKDGVIVFAHNSNQSGSEGFLLGKKI
jgi:succinylglutamate desuccinylase